MKWSIPIGRVLGIRLGIHYTFFLIVAWMGWLGWRYDGIGASLWAIGMVFLLFSCVILHELGHCIVAMRFGVEVNSITLLPIGGVAAMRSIPETPWKELLIALAGPAVNVLILASIIPFAGWPGWLDEPLIPSSVCELVAALLRANMILVAFNMIPAFPMDGGRVLRSCLAMVFQYRSATAWAAVMGRLVGVLFVVIGFGLNPFLILIGAFVFLGAEGEHRSVAIRESVRDHTVGSLMRTHFGTVRSTDTVRACLTAYHDYGHEHFVVSGTDGQLRGLLPESIWKRIVAERGPDEWIGRHVPYRYMSLNPQAALRESIQDILGMQQEIFPVMEDRRVVGVLVTEDLKRYIRRETIAKDGHSELENTELDVSHSLVPYGIDLG